MSVEIKRICDLCGEEIKEYEKTKWKLKYFLPDRSGGQWGTIDAHEECLIAIAKEARLRMRENEVEE